MTTYFVTRHAGALDWAARRNIAAVAVAHLDMSAVAAGDVVLGTLPVNLIADVNGRGARYFHLAMELPLAARGVDLTADDMDRYGAQLIEYRAERVANARPVGLLL